MDLLHISPLLWTHLCALDLVTLCDQEQILRTLIPLILLIRREFWTSQVAKLGDLTTMSADIILPHLTHSTAVCIGDLNCMTGHFFLRREAEAFFTFVIPHNQIKLISLLSI